MTWGSIRRDVLVFADDVPCLRISTLLEPEGSTRGNPFRLEENRGIAAVGSNVNGTGFVIALEEAERLLALSPANRQVVKRYIRSNEVNGAFDHRSGVAIIDFGNRELSEAKGFEGPFEIVNERVRPHRESITTKPKIREYWWRYESSAVALYAGTAKLRRVLCLVQTSKTQIPVFVPPDHAVFTHKLIVFATDAPEYLAVLSSSVHWAWIMQRGSSMKSDPVYTPTDVFATFPFPVWTNQLATVGEKLHARRREIMLRRRLGLTALYTRVNDPSVDDDADAERIRQLHVELDEATMEAYGWGDLACEHDFYTYRQMLRFTVSPAARVELLDRLLDENHRRAAAEGQVIPDQTGLF
jgi:hypothetical protein